MPALVNQATTVPAIADTHAAAADEADKEVQKARRSVAAAVVHQEVAVVLLEDGEEDVDVEGAALFDR